MSKIYTCQPCHVQHRCPSENLVSQSMSISVEVGVAHADEPRCSGLIQLQQRGPPWSVTSHPSID